MATEIAPDQVAAQLNALLKADPDAMTRLVTVGLLSFVNGLLDEDDKIQARWDFRARMIKRFEPWNPARAAAAALRQA